MGEFQIKEGATNVPQNQPVKKKRIWWKILLAWLGGFIAFPLVLAGAAAIAGTLVSTKDLVAMTGNDPNKILGEEYLNKTLLQSVMDILDKTSKNEFKTLDDINRVSPMVRSTIEDVYKTLANSLLGDATGVELDWDAIKDKEFTTPESSSGAGDQSSPLVEALKDQLLENITIVSLLESVDDLNNDIFKFFLYPVNMTEQLDEEGNVVVDEQGNPVMVRGEGFDTDHPYTLKQLLEGDKFFNNITDMITIGDVIPNDSENPNKIIEAMSTWHLDEIATNIKTLAIKDIFNVEGNALLTAIGDWKLDPDNFATEEDVNALLVGDLLGSISSNPIIERLANFRIGNLKGLDMKEEDGKWVVIPGSKWDLTEHILIDDVLGDTESPLLDSFRGKTLKEVMESGADNIRLIDIVGEDAVDTGSPKYNRVIHSILKNVSRKEYEAYMTEHPEPAMTYEEWFNNPEINNKQYNAKVSDLTDPDTINGLKISELMDVPSTGVAKNLVDALDAHNATLGTLGDAIGELTMGEFFGIDPNATSYDEVRDDIPFVLWTLRNTGLDDLSDSMNTLTIGGALEVINPVPIYKRDASGNYLDENGYVTTDPEKYVLLHKEDGCYVPASGTAEDGKVYYVKTLNGGDPYDYEYEKASPQPVAGSDLGDSYYLKVKEPSNSVLITIQDAKLNDSDGLMDLLRDGKVRLKDVIDMGGSSKLISNLGDTYLKDIGSEIETMTLGDMIDIHEKDEYEAATGVADGVTKYYQRTNSSEPYTYDEGTVLAADTNLTTPTQYYVKHEKSHPILISLKDVNILSSDGLQSKFTSLKFNEVFTYEDCEDSTVLKALWENNDDGNFAITGIGDAMKNVNIVDLLASDIYETTQAASYEVVVDGHVYIREQTSAAFAAMSSAEKTAYYANKPKKIKATWWFLLTESTELFNDDEEKVDPDLGTYDSTYVFEKGYVLKKGASYNIESMDKLVNNLTYHVQHETLYALHDAGLLTCDRSDLDKMVGPQHVGDMTIDGLIGYINLLP